MIKSTLATGFEKASDIVYPRIIASVSGREKCGKTHFALSAPGPIALFNSDIGLEGVVHKFTPQKDIFVYTFDIPDEHVEAHRVWNSMYAAWEKCIDDPEIRTIIADTATDLWDLLRIAEFGKLTPGSGDVQYKWGPVNAKFKKLLNRGYKRPDKNFIFLHKMKKVYVNNDYTGEWERSGFGNMGHEVQVNAEVWREPQGGPFHILVKDCRQNETLAGTDYPGIEVDDISVRQMLAESMVNFPYIAQQVISGTTEEDWV